MPTPGWEEVDDYLTDTLVPEDEALADARRSASETTMPYAGVAPNQGKLLSLLVEIAGARRVLEFGRLAGYSTIWLARAVGERGHVVDPDSAYPGVDGIRTFFERVAAHPQLDATAIQTVGSKGWDGFALVLVREPTM